jgi:hypothetical protein
MAVSAASRSQAGSRALRVRVDEALAEDERAAALQLPHSTPIARAEQLVGFMFACSSLSTEMRKCRGRFGEEER